jgi:hypothetical protein
VNGILGNVVKVSGIDKKSKEQKDEWKDQPTW